MAKLKKQSKRQKLSKKYSIQKKVREHRRKMRKEAKAKGGPVRRKLRRDLGIPNSCPFKGDIVANMLRRKAEREEKILREREEKKQQQLQEQQQKEAAGAAAAAALQAEGHGDAVAMEALAAKAAATTEAFESAAAAVARESQGPTEADLALQSVASSLSVSTSSKQQHIAALQRQQQQQLRHLLAAADVIIHVLDARLPLAYRCAGLERWALREGKKVILLLNKIDLVPATAVAAWLQQLQRSSVSPVLAFKCSSSSCSSSGKRGRWSTADPLHAGDKLKRSSSHALGIQSLMRLLSSIGHAAAKPSRGGDAVAAAGAATMEGDTMAVENDGQLASSNSSSTTSSSTSNKGSTKAFLTVGVVGYPNVGKSSVINALTRSASSAGVAALPGSTKVLKYIRLDSKTQLIDSPGVLFSPPAKEEDIAKILPHPHSLFTQQQQQQQQQQHQKPLVASASLLLQSLLPVPQIPNPEAVAEALINISSAYTLQRVYQLPSFSTSREALQGIAARRGKLKKGGVADLNATAKIFLQEWQEGRIPYYALPSAFKDAEGVRLVSVAEGTAEAEVAALQQELVERQLASLREPGTAAAPAAAADTAAAETPLSTHGEMRLMFGEVIATKRQKEQQRIEAQASERMEHVALRQKQRKLERKRRRGEPASVAMEEDEGAEQSPAEEAA